MSELCVRAIERYLVESSQARATPPPHTLRNYGADLAQLLDYFRRPEMAPPEPRAIDLLLLREWLASLYNQGLDRRIASAASWPPCARFFRFLLREGIIAINVAALVRTPKAPKTLPAVLTAEQTNTLVDGVARTTTRPAASRARPRHFRTALRLRPARQRTGGPRISTISTSPKRWIRVRGKGRKERQVPLPGKAAAALDPIWPSGRWSATSPPSS